jgi:Ni,Fe-hydrogenase III large subunit/Ni,Fe-hydrogenase III component G
MKNYIPQHCTIEEHGKLNMFKIEQADVTQICSDLYRTHNLPLKTITAFDERSSSGGFKIVYVFGVPGENIFIAPYIVVEESFPSLTPAIHEASLYERKIATFFGLVPEGHPHLRSLILHENWPVNMYPLRKDFSLQTRPKAAHNPPFEFRKIQGEGIYELPVGPVHAGIIEPGHFRFNLAGEEILNLEPRMGYSHKGTEKLFENIPLTAKLKLAERISGDSSFAYSVAFCQALESLAEITVPERATYLRAIYCELERLANHFGDIGAIMTDTGFNFGGAQGTRLRERIMRINERLTGSRFLRGVNTIGGVTVDIDENTRTYLLTELKQIRRDFDEVMEVAEDSSSLLNRLKETGILAEEIARDHGVTGVPARALGIAHDARVDYPYSAYEKLPVEISTAQGGDVYARFLVRIKEVFHSLTLITAALERIPGGAHCAPTRELSFKNDSYAISVVEGWRGDIVCFISTDNNGTIARVDMRDPSFLNWDAVGYAGRGNMVPDFPLINKSFNLSYSGNDL